MMYKAIIQLMSGDEAVIKSVASQINNLRTALNNKVEVELVCHGQSADFVMNAGDKWADIIQKLLSMSVKITACENMLKAKNISVLQLYPGIETVPAAIAELVIKQQEGWSYIKAGF